MLAVTVAVGGGLLAAALAEVLAHAVALGPGLRPIADSMSVVATALFFGAGVSRYARWRVTGEAQVAAHAAALLVFAVLSFPMALLARTFVATSTSGGLGGLARLLVTLAVAAILAPVLGVGPAEWRPGPGRLAGAGFAVVVGLFVVLAAAAGSLDPRLVSSAGASVGLDLGGAAVWMILSGLCLRAGVRRRSPSTVWSAASLLLLGCASTAAAAAEAGGRWSWFVTAGALTLGAAGVSAANAGADVRDVLFREVSRLAETSAALAEAQRMLTAIEARREVLVHDAHSMIGGVRAASTTLDRHAGSLAPDSARRLRAAMDVELERLARLIDGSGPEPIRSFGLDQLVSPIVETLRGQGLIARCDLDGLWGLGRPDDVAEVVRNLLVNAVVHAPGSAVAVWGVTDGDNVRLYVDDSGPGIPSSLADKVFERGFGAGPGRGTGLGLFVARQLAREQGGDLEVCGGHGGGTRLVLSLPAGLPAGIVCGGSVESVVIESRVTTQDRVEVGQPSEHLGGDDAVDSHMSVGAETTRQRDDYSGGRPGVPTATDDRQVDVDAPTLVRAGLDQRVTAAGQGDG